MGWFLPLLGGSLLGSMFAGGEGDDDRKKIKEEPWNPTHNSTRALNLPPPPILPPKSLRAANPKQLYSELNNILLRDSDALNQRYTPYRSSQTSTSPVEARYAMLRNMFANKGLPYSKATQQVMNRPVENTNQFKKLFDSEIGPHNIDRYVDMMENRYGKGNISPQAQNRLKDSFSTSNELIGSNIANIDEMNTLREKNNNLRLVKTLQNSGMKKIGDREILMNMLKSFGEQNKAIDSNGQEVQKFLHEEKQRVPRNRLDAFKRMTENYSDLGSDVDRHPDITNLRAKQLLAAAKEYGLNIDGGLKGLSGNTTSPYYTEPMHAGAAPLSDSWNNLYNLDPKLKNQYSGDISRLRKDLVRGETDDLEPLKRNLQLHRKEVYNKSSNQLNKKLNELDNYYIKNNLYGQQRHKEAREAALSQLGEVEGQHTGDFLDKSARNYLKLKQDKYDNRLEEFGLLSDLGSYEKKLKLNSINEKNKLGVNDFERQQMTLRNQYDDFLRRQAADNPHLGVQNSEFPSFSNIPSGFRHERRPYDQDQLMRARLQQLQAPIFNKLGE